MIKVYFLQSENQDGEHFALQNVSIIATNYDGFAVIVLLYFLLVSTLALHFVNKMLCFLYLSRVFCLQKTIGTFWNILLCKMYQNVMQKYIFASKMFTSKKEFLQVLRKDLQKTKR